MIMAQGNTVIMQEYLINAPISEVWRALTDARYISSWGGGPAKMDGNAGTDFSLWGGDIHGKNIEGLLDKKLVQEWYGGDWAEPSFVTFSLVDQNGRTKVTLEHKNVPEAEVADFDAGWRDFYMGPLKSYLESKK